MLASFWLLLFQGEVLLPGKHWLLFFWGSLYVTAALAYWALITHAHLLWKYTLRLFLTSYITFLCDRVTPGHFLLLSCPFLVSKDVEFHTFSFFVCTSHSLAFVFLFDDLLINRTCRVSLYDFDPQPKHHKAKEKSKPQEVKPIDRGRQEEWRVF